MIPPNSPLSDDLAKINATLGDPLARLGLFGSRARGGVPRGDVDLLIEVIPGSSGEVYGLLRRLALSMPIMQVDMGIYQQRSGEREHDAGYHLLIVEEPSTADFLARLADHRGQCLFIEVESGTPDVIADALGEPRVQRIGS